MGNSCCRGERVLDRTPKADCVFCGICQNKSPSRTVYQDQRMVVFWDRAPAAKVHVLVVPRDHIVNINDLTPADIGLVEEMHAVGSKVLNELAPDREHKLGYHIPPFTSVDHLHCHGFALPHNTFPPWTQMKYTLSKVWMPASELEALLKEGQVVGKHRKGGRKGRGGDQQPTGGVTEPLKTNGDVGQDDEAGEHIKSDGVKVGM